MNFKRLFLERERAFLFQFFQVTGNSKCKLPVTPFVYIFCSSMFLRMKTNNKAAELIIKSIEVLKM